jgi:hypothetical protein
MQAENHRLKSLPQLDPPAALWSSIRDELDQRRSARRLRRGALASLAMAACAVVVVVTIALQVPNGSHDPAGPQDNALVQARQVSAVLESQLRLHHLAAVDTASVESLVWLENELHWLDLQLSAKPDDIELWQRRAELLSEMSQLYGASSWQAQIQLTSY